MTRWSFVWRELGRNILRNPGTAFSAVLSLALLFVLFNMLWVATRSTDELYESLMADMRMEIFLPDSLADSSVAQISARVQTIPGIRSNSYVTREAARDELVSLMGVDLLANDTLNPLPRSFVLTFVPEYLTIERLTGIENQLALVTGSTQIQYGRKWLENTEQTRGVIRKVGVIIGFLILLATVVSSSNNIHLMSRARVGGLLQMQLLGAGKGLIAMPFVLEGALVGAVASGIAWVVVIYGHAQLTFVKIAISMPETSDILIFCLLTSLLGAISGYYGVRRLLD